jgi:hypothetical protein
MSLSIDRFADQGDTGGVSPTRVRKISNISLSSRSQSPIGRASIKDVWGDKGSGGSDGKAGKSYSGLFGQSLGLMPLPRGEGEKVMSVEEMTEKFRL